MKIIIFGNSGSGKSTLAKRLSSALPKYLPEFENEQHKLPHLDLDTIAWQDTKPPERMPIQDSQLKIDEFIGKHNAWVVEGCYADLLALLLSDADEMIFMNLPVEACVSNAKNRPWEPHKYPSKEAQDANLNMLIDWIVDYDSRDDVFSRLAHEKLYAAFEGRKSMYISNAESQAHGYDIDAN